jgi:hypothetical protein
MRKEKQMLRNLKVLGLAAIAALALGAVGTSTASAAPQFHFESEHTIVTGQQSTLNALAFDVGTVKCGIVQFGGTSTVFTTTTMTLNPTFHNCLLDEEEEATFTINGCAFVFHVGANEEHLTGTMSIECPDGERIEIDAPECTITVPPQGNLGSVTFTNEGAEMTRGVVLDLSLAGLDYVEHGAACVNETVTTNNGTYTGKVTTTGENTMGAHRGLWVA